MGDTAVADESAAAFAIEGREGPTNGPTAALAKQLEVAPFATFRLEMQST